MDSSHPYHLRRENIYAVPILHYQMEFADHVRRLFLALQPDCVAVELPEPMEQEAIHAASRLPDISLLLYFDEQQEAHYLMCEPCDPAFEGVRSALEAGIAAYCIDLHVSSYPMHTDAFPDAYAIQRIGLKAYYETYRHLVLQKHSVRNKADSDRELHMAKRLKELSLRYERVLFISGMFHTEAVLSHLDRIRFPDLPHAAAEGAQLCTLTEESCREVMAEPPFISGAYEEARAENHLPIDRQQLIYNAYKQGGEAYSKEYGAEFPGYHLRNLMKFLRNYALITHRLMPDLFQILTAAKGCVDHNFAYEVWKIATEYPHLKNVDNLPELDLTIEEVWGASRKIHFHLKAPRRKGFGFRKRYQKGKEKMRFEPPGPFTICSYPPEDVAIERFGEFLKRKGTQVLTEEGARTIPFTSSLEDGIDTRETIRHWFEKKLYVKTRGKPPGGVGSVVIIFEEPKDQDDRTNDPYTWCMTWLGEHEQESDMAFYGTFPGEDVVGPGISRCRYGGFMMSYPPRRMFDVWMDADYAECRDKAEVLLMAAVDYAVQPVVVYVAANPPRSQMKSFARRFGKKIVYIPLGQLSAPILNKLRTFHVLDGHHRRDGAGEYIY